MKRSALAWTFSANQAVSSIPESTHVDIAVDGDTVLVSADQWLFALEVESGKILWKTELRPRQSPRRYDSPWTKIGRHKQRYFVRCYEDLYVLDVDSGKRLWHLDCGAFARPWPTVDGEHVFVSLRPTAIVQKPGGAPRDDEAREAKECAASAIRISLADDKVDVSFLSCRDVPRGEELHSQLQPPPSGTPEDSAREPIHIVFEFDEIAGQPPIEYEVSVALRADGQIFFRNFRWFEWVIVRQGDKELLRVVTPPAY